MTKLKAFTLPEMLVTMVIASIVITGAYQLLDSINTSFENSTESDRSHIDDAIFFQQIRKDIRSSKWVYLSDENQMLCEGDSSTVYYDFGETVTRCLEKSRIISSGSIELVNHLSTELNPIHRNLLDTIALRFEGNVIRIVKLYSYCDKTEWNASKSRTSKN
ncbi:MAG: prepilin-type N-terminal cleavage/methylation domain-containing protein [Cryomorphaceae bacterium]